ncbi:GNAT family N-acetyltransferase [Paucibacter sp. AS339]|uniref:GNAT family N-acetyltransferase n=1 Tax=Paucibacter hankyongi TaxID=3133434 RepID=UPI00309D6415
MLLRPSTSSDAADIAKIYLASRETFLPFAPLAHSKEAVLAWVQSELVTTRNVTLAVADGETLGFVATVVSDAVLWVDQLYVRPDSVGQGFGAALLRQALAGARGRVRLYTFQANTGARRFYERFGFVPIELTDGEANEEKCPDVLYELWMDDRCVG